MSRWPIRPISSKLTASAGPIEARHRGRGEQDQTVLVEVSQDQRSANADGAGVPALQLGQAKESL